MENYSYNTYPDSGDSSPRSREIDFENPPPWDEQTQQLSQNYKVKFMCSYGGKIHPRPHDNQLSYIGGETKILAVDRTIKFSSMISKLTSLCGDGEVAFKYQLPGEDLDALISVTNDDDLEHMMHEYDRLYRASGKPARMRLFLFAGSSNSSFGSDGSKSDRDRFVEALNSGPSHATEKGAPPNNVDFLFGLEKGIPQSPPVKVHDSIPEPVVVPPPQPEMHTAMGADDRLVGMDRVMPSDHVVNPVEIQRQLQELQRLQMREHEQQQQQQQQQAMYRRKSDDNLISGFPGDYYVQKMPEKAPPANLPVSMPQTLQAPAGFWSDRQISGGGYPATMTTPPGPPEQQMYMFPPPGAVYHTPMVRSVTGQTSQGYYPNVQRMAHEVYREQPMYNMVPQQQQQQPPPLSAAAAQNLQQQGAMGAMRPIGGGVGVTDGGYAQMAYDSPVGRQVYYTAQGGVLPTQYQGVGGVAVSSGEMRPVGGGGGGGPGGGLNQEGKVVTKVTQASV